MKRNFRRRIFLFLAVGLLILGIGSCSVTVSGSSSIRVSNTSGTFTLSHLYITPHSSSNWGNDLLSPGVISPGNSATFGVDPGVYDVRVIDTTPYTATAINVYVNSGNTITLYFNGTTLSN
jgi:hypothetical protein